MSDYRIDPASGAVFQVGETGKRHILPGEWAALAAAGVVPVPLAGPDLDAIPDAAAGRSATPPPAQLQYLEDVAAALTKYLAAVKPPG